MASKTAVWLVSLLGIGAVLTGTSALGQTAVLIDDPPTATRLMARFLALTEGWTKEARFTPAELRAMENGKQWEDLMVVGFDDPLGRKVLKAGEPSYDAMAAFYPGKILDRTVLGTMSDPWNPSKGSGEEFIVWWNGAISANLLERRISGTLQPLAENTNVVFRVGKNAEMFGREGTRFSRLGYQDGYLPIVVTQYESDGIRFEQTCVADRPGEPSRAEDVALVRFVMTNATGSPKTAELHAEVVLVDETKVKASDQNLVNDKSLLILVHSDDDARFDEPRQRLSHRFELKPGEQAVVVYAIPYRPEPLGQGVEASPSRFDRVFRRTQGDWQAILNQSMQLDLPEERINRVWKAILLMNFVLADGPRMTYGSGMRYNRSFYPVESALTANDLAFYGYGAMSHELLDMCVRAAIFPREAGRKYQNRRGVALRQIYENYRLTRRLDLVRRFYDDLIRVADEIVADHHATMVETGGQRPLHWGLLPPDKPGVDVQASTQRVYVVAHSISNCQGLQDFGRLLIHSGIDPERGQKYVKEAKSFRKAIFDALDRATIFSEERPPFVPIDTLYFAETPDFGPLPYEHLGLGRLQGAYYHYWVDMLLNYNFFNPDDLPARRIVDYLEKKGGFLLGCTESRFRPDYGWVSNVYNSGYYELLLRDDRIDQFLLGFYSRFVFAMTRHALVGSESTPFTKYNTRNGGFVAANQPFPNSAASGETLRILRLALIMEELRDNVETGTIQLTRGIPRAWLKDGQELSVESAPTFFGPMSFWIESEAKNGKITATIEPPRRDPYKMIVISLRHPDGKPMRSVRVNGQEHKDFDPDRSRVRLNAGPESFKVEASY